MPQASSGPVLVTGAGGLVGAHVARTLTQRGVRVAWCDLDTDANRAAAAKLAATARGLVEPRLGDLTNRDYVSGVLTDVLPSAICHLAAAIPPGCYANPERARAINVGATQNLVHAAEQLAAPPRFILASSVAVYPPRNPHRHAELLTAQTPTAPMDVYGQHKVEAEGVLRHSHLQWLVLRLAGVVDVAQSLRVQPGMIFYESALPGDGRMHTVDVRDVATAFANATTAPIARQTLLIGGDPTHHQRHGDFTNALAKAIGLRSGLPAKPLGDPANDGSWYNTDWVDTTESQAVLDFQHHSFDETMTAMRKNAGWLGSLIGVVSPLATQVVARQGAYPRGYQGFAQPWQKIEERWPQALVRRPRAVE